MSKFIVLYNNNNEVYVNVDHIIHMFYDKTEERTYIYTTEKGLYKCRKTPEEILKMI